MCSRPPLSSFLFPQARAVLCLLWFICFFLGCDPPGKKACTEDRQCAINEYCEPKERRCTEGCSDDSRCTEGKTCFENKCNTRLCGASLSAEKESCYDGKAEEISDSIRQKGGTCHAGERYCIHNGQAWSPCYAQKQPRSEICDGLDNNCNGQIDEGLSCECTPHALQSCSTSPQDTVFQDDNGSISLCRKGFQRCTPEGRWGRCEGEILPHQAPSHLDSCFLRDSNCDGKLDEGCACEPNTPPRPCDIRLPNQPTSCDDETGVLTQGEQRCEKRCPSGEVTGCPENEMLSRWSPCRPVSTASSFRLPAPEELTPCDGLDNDCDGRIDNRSDQPDLPLSRPCYPGLPGCTTNLTQNLFTCEGLCTTGLQYCDPKGGWSEECKEAVVPQSEICDGLDNDCDGQIDNQIAPRPCFDAASGCTQQPDGRYTCTPPCRDGLQNCINGAWEACKDQILPKLEEKGTDACNDGLDNDCNGLTDQDDPSCQ